MARQVLSVDDARREARRRLPRGIFEYIDRGAGDETALRRLRQDFDAVVLTPRMMVDVSTTSTSATLFGVEQPLPVVVAPTAAAGLVWHDGELALAEAAAAAGIPFCVATGSITAMERVAESGAELWFQLYLWKDRALSYQLMERATATGIENLVLTADTVVLPIREHNIRNGFEVPIQASARAAIDMIRHPAWVWRVLLRYLREGGIPTYQHYPQAFRSKITRKATSEQVALATDLTWDGLAELRRRWPGRLILKGVLHPADAVRAAACGVDAVVVSSHGGRNLDAAISPIAVLPRIAEAVGHRIEVLADSGVRRGADVLKLVAHGAKAVMIGRSVLFGTAWAGEAGARRVIEILRDEMATDLALLGCPSLSRLDATWLGSAADVDRGAGQLHSLHAARATGQ